MEIQLKQGLIESPESIDIRKQVFIEEQGFENEFDAIDDTAFHAVIFADGALPESMIAPSDTEKSGIPAATARLYTDDGDIYHIGRVAVLKPYRGCGLGAVIMETLEDKARTLGGKEVHVSAQVRVMKFYEKLGYKAFGDEYPDEDCPHIAMKKSL